MRNYFLGSFLLSSLLFLSACAPTISPNTYDASEVGMASRVIPGVVISKRMVNIDGNSGIGGLAGAAGGAALGSTLGGSPVVHIIGAVGGAIAAGVFGNGVDKTINTRHGFEYMIKLQNQSTIAVIQPKEMQFGIGQHVLVVLGPTTRIIADDTFANSSIPQYKKNVHQTN